MLHGTGTSSGQPLKQGQPVVGALEGQEFLVAALFDQAPPAENQDAVGLADGGEAVGDGDGGAAGEEGAAGLFNELFRL